MQSRFHAKKKRILDQIEVPADTYSDLSPKGSIDEPIRSLIAEINHLDGLVTTSSCSGRISVFLEGRKEDDAEESAAGPGGKGGGGTWLFISHDPISLPDVSSESHFMTLFGLPCPQVRSRLSPAPSARFIHLKFEPMILHILTASVQHAQKLVTAAMSSGFRESGALSLAPAKNGETNPMVAVRSTGYSFDAIIGFQDEFGNNVAMVDESYLQVLMRIANERFEINTGRIERFRAHLQEAIQATPSSSKLPTKPEWEDADTRKQRKKEEGLRRQRALQAQSHTPGETVSAQPDDLAVGEMFE